jgi:hypothetical protein
MSNLNRPPLVRDYNQLPIPQTYTELAFQGDYTGTNLIHKGLALPGTSTSSPGWQIALLTYDGSNNLLSITWPLAVGTTPTTSPSTIGHASTEFIFTWANRATYTYQ